MTATNHYLTGVAIAIIIKNPMLAIPMAFASHFVLDVLPHFGLHERKLRRLWQLRSSILDIILLILAVGLTIRNYPNWYIIVGLVAYSPDIAWLYRFTLKEKFGKLPPPAANAFNTWHYNIQKYERWWGSFVEVGFALTLFWLLYVR